MRLKGFTLVELLLAIVIIGILASVLSSRFGDIRERSVLAALRSDLRNVYLAQEMYYQTHDFRYAKTVEDLIKEDLFSPIRGVDADIDAADSENWRASVTHTSTGAICEFDSVSGVAECSYRGRPERRIDGPTRETVLSGPASP